MLNVYLDPATINSRKVLAGLDLLGADFATNHVSYAKGEHRTEEAKKVNPMATMPWATDGDLVITESNAIMIYAADTLGRETPYYPADPKKRADIHRWLFWEASGWFVSCYPFLIENVVKPLQGAEPDQKALDDETPNWEKLAGVLEERLSKSKWLTGDSVTLADIACASPMHMAEYQKLPGNLDKYPGVKRWYFECVKTLPSWKKTQTAVEDAFLPASKGASSAAANGVSSKNNDTLTSGEVRANLNYTKDVPAGELVELYYYEHERANNVHGPGGDEREVVFHDGWSRRKEFSADKQGFSLHDFHSSFDKWEDEEATRESFYPEVVDFLKKEYGAKRVLVFDHTIRTRANAAKKVTQETDTTQRAPIMLVHCDYTDHSGPARVKQLLPDEADDLLSRRVAFFNVWKPVRRLVEERPLAMCDVTTSPDKDFMKLHLHYRDRDGENYIMRYSDKHKWWYFPKMTPEHAIVLKTYDSETDGRARFVGHSAFQDPTSPADAPARESVEIRTIAFF
jgi:glutathione S-transferase